MSGAPENRRPEITVFGINPEEIIVDSFAGGGGASVGIEWALGRSPDIAINHDAQAVAMHAANHPNTEHFVEDVWDVDPIKACKGRPVALAWFSPDCKHFSKAKGGKPVSKKIRGLAWIVVKWAKAHKAAGRPIRVIMLENVEEFQTWGPLGEDNRPDKLRKGLTFRRWKSSLENLGYKVEFRELIAADYGAPTTRKRLFLVARCDGQPIRWPAPTHDKHGRYGLPKWRAAAECIDWTLACPSIFLTNDEGKAIGVKRPLAENTMRRIARGLQKFVIDNPKPFILGVGGRMGQSPERPVDRPLNTVTAKADSALAAPVLAKFRGDSAGTSIDAPMPTITAGPKERPAGAAHALAVVSAGIVPVTHQGADRNESTDEPMRTITGAHRGEKAIATAVLVGAGGPARAGEPAAVDRPVGALTTENHRAVAEAVLEPVKPILSPQAPIENQAEAFRQLDSAFLTEHANASNPRSWSADEPLRTQCAEVKGGHFALTAATLVRPAHGEVDKNGKKRGKGEHDAEAPLPTQTGSNEFALAAATLITTGYGERPGQAPRAPGLEKPLGTIVNGQKHAAVAAFIAKHNGGHEATGQRLDDAMSTLVARENKALVASYGVKLKGTCQHGQQIDLPLPTVNAEGTHHARADAFLVAYYGNEKDGQGIDDPMRTLTAKERLGLVRVEGELYQIVDIGMRMLVPPELYKAQGFPETYKINIEFKGKPLPKDAQVRMCGNSVSPYPCKELVLANFAEQFAEAAA